VAWPSGPRLAIAVVGGGRRLGSGAADFGRERRIEKSRQFADFAVRELGGGVEAGEEEFVVAVAVEDNVVDYCLEGVFENLLGDFAE
jgi:predicted methyltransferase MtxX (methanogen marker protein 4)